MFVFEDDFKQRVYMASSSIDGPSHSDNKIIWLRNNFGDFLSKNWIYTSYCDIPYQHSPIRDTVQV